MMILDSGLLFGPPCILYTHKVYCEVEPCAAVY